MLEIFKGKIKEEWMEKAKENPELLNDSKELSVEDPVSHITLDLDYEVNISMGEDFKGAIYCNSYKNIILYYKFYELEDFNLMIEQFLEDCKAGMDKLVKTKAKLSTRFKAPIRMFVRVDGRVTLVDKNTDLILLDKINPTNLDYQKAEKKFLINSHRIKKINKNK